MRIRTIALVATVLLAAARNPLAAEDLRSRLDAALAAVPAGGEAGVVVCDAASGEILYSRDADRRMSIASVTKALVAAAALWQLGPDYRFRTRVAALGPVVDGAAPGLVVIGGGDPCFDGHFTDKDPDAVFRGWAATLKAHGVQRVDGDLVIDASLFGGPCKPATYPQDDENQSRWYSAPASAFAWNDNCIEVRVVPSRPGEPARVQVRPRSARIAVHNDTRTVAGRSASAIRVSRDGESNGVTVGGSYSRATDWFPLAIASDPDLLAGDELKAALADAGIPVSGVVRLGSADGAQPPLVEVEEPLVPAITLMNQHSQNFYGEQLLRLIGVAVEHEGSVAAGAKALALVLAQHVPGAAEGAELIDGSGLSYGNRASAGFICATLRAVHAAPFRDAFYASLKLDDKVKPAAHVKTGTLAIAACLAGFVDRADGSRWAFAVLLNKGDARGFGWGGDVREKALKAIAAP